MQEVWLSINELLSEERRVVLARIIRQDGAAPRGIGTACLFLEDGTLLGTIGGGLLEFRVSEKAREVFANGRSALLHFELTGKDVAETDMLCGGIVDIYIELLDAGNETTCAVFQKLAQTTQARGKGLLLTVISEGLTAASDNHAFILADGRATGSLPPFLNEDPEQVKVFLKSQAPEFMEGEAGDADIFIEPVKPDDVLYLFGAGHVSTFVASLAKMVGFKVTVIDDREEFANSARFPQADEILVTPFEEAFERIEINETSYIAIITRGHKHDLSVLKESLRFQPAYIGMIGSKRKKRVIYAALEKSGISPERLAEVYAPIGIPIGDETPQEIAVSIAAQLIQVRASKIR